MNNECLNPSLANNNDGWTGEGDRVAAAGFDRPYVYRLTGTTSPLHSVSAHAVAAAAEQWTGSLSIRCTSDVNVRLYLEYYDGSDSWIGDSGTDGGQDNSIMAGLVRRIWRTGLTPAGTAKVRMSCYIDLPASEDVCDITMVRLTQGVDTAYYDGDSLGWEWAGAAGNSSSLGSPASGGVTVCYFTYGFGWLERPMKIWNGNAWIAGEAG